VVFLKHCSQNQANLFLPLDYDQVVGKEINQKHRESSTVHSKNEKETEQEKFRKDFLQSNDLLEQNHSF
jgi:hypothetical protein